MARERSIVVRLRAEVSDFNRQMGAAGRSLSEFEKAQQRMGGAATTTMGRMVQSARANDREWTMVGRSLLAVGTGITAIGTAMAVTGISYNTLQQQSRAALTTLLGSTEAVNAQMAEFDQFARESPFAREVWLQAQQQMLGFGIEAQKVVPYLDAIENAVAATGGSNQDISELTRIFSQIQSAAKITAVDLMQFGQRGVDAATLIGSQMGMTGAEVRESITAGTLDAGQALDALAAGMQQRFGGAADNVKNTMVGALDRVKAAFRDLSSELVTPLVNPEGGGALVEFLNGLADAMRAFQGAPSWVKGGVTALAGLTAAATLGTGALMTALPRIVEYRDALRTLGNAHPQLARVASGLNRFTAAAAKVGAAGAGFAALTVGVAKLYDQFADNRLPLGIEGTTAALMGLNGVSINEQFTQGFDGIADAAERLLSGRFDDRINQWAGGIGRALGIETNTFGNAAAQFEQIGDALAGLVGQGDAEVAAALFESLYAQVDRSKISSEQFMSLMPAYGDALSGMAVDAELAGGGMGDLAVGTSDAQAAMEEAREANQKLREEIHQSVGGLVDWTGGIAAADFSLSKWTQSLEDQIEKLRNFDSNMETVFDRVSDIAGEDAARQIADRLREMGDEGVAAAGALAAASDGDFQRAIEALFGLEEQAGETSSSLADMIAPEIHIDTTQAARDLAAFTAMMAATGGLIPVDADMDGATDDVVQWGTSMVGTTVPVDADMSDADDSVNIWAGVQASTGIDLAIDADTARAATQVAAWAAMVAATDPVADVDADTSPADGTFGKWMGRIEKDTATTNLDADDDPAQSTFAGFAGSATRARVVVPLRADDKPARTVTGNFTSWAGNRNPKVDLGAQDRKGRASTNTFTRWANRRSARVSLGARSTKARSTTNSLTRWMNRRSGRVSVGANDSSARKTVNNLVASIGKRSTSITVNARKGSGPSIAGFAAGGAIRGPGSGTSDSIIAALSNGEHVWTAREVKALGGHGAMAALRASVLSGSVRGFANGGAVTPTFQAPQVSVAPAVNVGGNEWAVYVQATPDSGYIRAQARVVVNGEIADQARSLGNVSVH